MALSASRWLHVLLMATGLVVQEQNGDVTNSTFIGSSHLYQQASEKLVE
jgi:hypothetical protein